MSGALATGDVPAALDLGHDQAIQLESVLAQEFAALGTNNLSAFEALQARKDELIGALTALVARFDSSAANWIAEATPGQPPLTESAEWIRLREVLDRCRDAHRRNDVLIRTRLDAIRAALAVLQISDNAQGGDLYDRRGRISSAFGLGGYADA